MTTEAAPAAPWNGVPIEPHVSRRHWLGIKGKHLRPDAWNAHDQTWNIPGGPFKPDEIAFTYHGPCLTPSEIAAALAAEQRATLERAVAWCRATAADLAASANVRAAKGEYHVATDFRDKAKAFCLIADAIDALPPPAAASAPAERESPVPSPSSVSLLQGARAIRREVKVKLDQGVPEERTARLQQVAAWLEIRARLEGGQAEREQQVRREAVAKEREECAQLAERDDRTDIAKEYGYIPEWLKVARSRAAAIRARSGDGA